jgi:hypothetical protein
VGAEFGNECSGKRHAALVLKENGKLVANWMTSRGTTGSANSASANGTLSHSARFARLAFTGLDDFLGIRRI